VDKEIVAEYGSLRVAGPTKAPSGSPQRRNKAVLQTYNERQNAMAEDNIDDLLNAASQGPGEEPEKESSDIKMQYQGDQGLQEAKATAQQRLSQADAFMILVAVDEIDGNKGIDYQWGSHQGSRASSHFVTEFMHQAILACMNTLATVDQAVQEKLNTVLVARGSIPHPMDGAKIIKKNISTGGVTVEPAPDQEQKT